MLKRQIEADVQTPLVVQEKLDTSQIKRNWRGKPFQSRPFGLITRWLNRDLPEDRRISLRIGWPLWLIPVVFINQLLAPHVVWVVLLVSLTGFYLGAYWWVRHQAPAIQLARRRVGTILVAGDMLQEEFELQNESQIPLLWAEFIDESTVPDYMVGRVVACEGANIFRWRSEVLCRQRGLFRLGPHQLRFQDPLGLFAVEISSRYEDVVLIYPRVVHLPNVQLPRGNSQGGERQRRPILGNLPAATVLEYQAGDSLRHVHWVSTARRGRMMVKELEIEPSGNIWLVLDLDQGVQQGAGIEGTLEQGVMVAASLAAELLGGREQRSVGLWAYSGESAATQAQGEKTQSGVVEVLPGSGSAHTWPILSALAAVKAGDLKLSTLLSSRRGRIGRGGTLTVITPVPSKESMAFDEAVNDEAVDDAGGDGPREGSMVEWVAELVHLKSVGVDSSVVFIVPGDMELALGEAAQALLARVNIPSTLIDASVPLASLLTFRRRRRVVRSTPTGGVVSYDVDEEVG